MSTHSQVVLPPWIWPGTFIDRSAWHHADGWRLYGVSPVRSNTIRRTRPDVSVTKHPHVKGVRRLFGAFRRLANRVKGYVRGELTMSGPVPFPYTYGRTPHKVRPYA